MADWIDKPTSIRSGEELDFQKLQSYLTTHLPESEGQLSIEQFPKGFSNLTYLISLGDQQMVLRRPPFGANIKSAHDMSREYKILTNLIKVYSKVPRPLLYCEDKSVIGAPFYIMERVHGVILRSKMPPEMAPEAGRMSGIANALIDTFAELHAVDYQAAGLKELGRPEGYIERQISGWTKRYFKAKTDEFKEIEQTAKWLSENLPPEEPPSLIHNDFKYDNLVLDAEDWTKVIAILDWEMATLGDPRMDLGTSIGYWINPNDPDFMQQLQLTPTTLPGNPTRSEVVEMYIQKSGRQIDHVLFFYLYGLFKIAVIIQQIYYRYKKGFTQDKRFARLNLAVQGCGIMAQQAIQKKKIEDLF